MTTRHMIDALTIALRSRSLKQLGLDPRTVFELRHGTQTDMKLSTLDLIQRNSGIPIEVLWAWYRLPEGAALPPETISRASADNLRM